MIVATRIRAYASGEQVRDDLHRVLQLMGERPGFLAGHVARNLDDQALWLLHSEWTNVGSYRRALSNHDIKVGCWPILAHAVDEASAFELIAVDQVLTQQQARGDAVLSD